MQLHDRRYFVRFVEGELFQHYDEDINQFDSTDHVTPVDRTSERFALWAAMDMFVITKGEIPTGQRMRDYAQTMSYSIVVDTEYDQWLVYHGKLGHFVPVAPEFDAGPSLAL